MFRLGKFVVDRRGRPRRASVTVSLGGRRAACFDHVPVVRVGLVDRDQIMHERVESIGFRWANGWRSFVSLERGLGLCRRKGHLGRRLFPRGASPRTVSASTPRAPCRRPPPRAFQVLGLLYRRRVASRLASYRLSSKFRFAMLAAAPRRGAPRVVRVDPRVLRFIFKPHRLFVATPAPLGAVQRSGSRSRSRFARNPSISARRRERRSASDAYTASLDK